MAGALVHTVDDKGEIHVHVLVRLLVVFFSHACSVYCAGHYRERYNAVWNVTFLYTILLKGAIILTKYRCAYFIIWEYNCSSSWLKTFRLGSNKQQAFLHIYFAPGHFTGYIDLLKQTYPCCFIRSCFFCAQLIHFSLFRLALMCSFIRTRDTCHISWIDFSVEGKSWGWITKISTERCILKAN